MALRSILPHARRSAPLLIILALVAAACTGPPGPPEGSSTVGAMAEELGADVVEQLRRGFAPEMSPDVAYVPRPYNVVVRFSGEGLGTLDADPRSSHSTPWDYHQRVPIMLYGPGYVRSGQTVDRSVDVTDIAATLAELTGSGFRAPDGEVLEEALLPEGERNGRPRAIAVVAYDGGGWNLLEQWPQAWPEQRRMGAAGTTYLNATIGSAPSVTTAIHANMGTGAYPEHHGLSEINGRLPDGRIGETFLDESDPRLIRLPTLADVWDLEHDNDPWVGIVAYESWHLGMMSHGTQTATVSLPGDPDRDVGVIWEPGEEGDPSLGRFTIREDFYALPANLPGDAELGERLREQDADDGEIDGAWMGWDLEDPLVVPALPAFVRHQQDALAGVLGEAPLGEDDLTDLLFVELKPTDFAGHLWNMIADEEEPVLRAQDDLLGALIEQLERAAGPDGYVLIVTADHGQSPLPESSGGLRVHPDVLKRRVEEYFGEPIVAKVTPSGLFLDRELAADLEISDATVARFVGSLRYRDVLPQDTDLEAIPEETLDERVFAAALPHSYLDGLTPEDAAALGEGLYPEGDLTGTDPAARFARLLG